MGANPTQAQGVALVLIGFTLIAAGFAADISVISLILGVAMLAGAVFVFLKCKRWEYSED